MRQWQIPATNLKERKPIKTWQAQQLGKVVDENNSIAILRAKWGYNATYHAIR